MCLKAVPLYLYGNTLCPPELKDVENDFHRRWLPQHELCDKELFHYTNSHGLQGILSERTLWLSDIRSFNDPDEIKYGRKLVVDVLRESEAQYEHPICREFLRGMRPFVESFERQIPFDVFVVCFCEDGNLLSQWRAYADHARGYSLGFNFSMNTRITIGKTDLSGKEIYFRKVIYCPTQQKSWVESYLEDAIKAVRGAGLALNEAYQAGLAGVQIILEMLLCFKHKAFAAEREWRLFRVTRRNHELDKVMFRDSCGLMIPYRPMTILDVAENGGTRFPLRSIMCGPALDYEPARSGIDRFLHQLSTDGCSIKIVPSEVEIGEPGYSLR